MIGRFKRLIQRIAASFVDEYRLNWVVASAGTTSAARPMATVTFAPLTTGHWSSLEHSDTPDMRHSLSFARGGLEGFALLANDMPLTVAHFASRAEYDRDGTWRLRPGEVALMDIATEESARGCGLAPRLIAEATTHYQAAGNDRLIAFIWWSNRPSLHAFAKAGWRKVGLSLEYCRRGKWRSIIIPIGLAMMID
jgi:GNAT superfamily N-acetyltransferase